MSENRKVQIPVEAVADTSGLDAMKEGMRDVAQVAQQAGAQASAGMDKIGAGALSAADKVDAANRKFEASIRKAMELNQALAAGPRGSSGFIEARAAQSGADVASLQPLLTQLRAVEEAQRKANAALNTGATTLNTVGMSARATAAAMRQVPAQFQDIVVSLQGGQAPMTVLLQQGSQLATVFGGVGPAARALGGYILGLVNPLTVGAAALGALAFAAHAGGEELRGFQNAATLTGNAIGLSASGFSQLRDSLAGIAGTKGKAAEVLTEIAKNGQLASGNVRQIAEAAILMEKATGQAVSKTLADFVKLADEPAKAAAELNKQYNFLTTSIYAQIKALEDQGEKQKAADLAERTYAEAMAGRAKGVVENVGLMEKAWRGLSGAAKAGWDAMLNVGREKTLADRFADVSGQVARGQGAFDVSAFGGNAEARAQLPANRAAMQSLFRQMEIEQRNTAAAQENAAATKAGMEAYDKAAKASEQYADKQTKLNKALKDYSDNLAELRKIPPDQVTDAIRKQLDPAVIARTEAGLRKSFKESGAAPAGESFIAGIRARIDAEKAQLKRLQDQLASGDFTDHAKLTSGEELALKIKQELTTSIKGQARAEKELALVQAERLGVVERERVAQEEQNKAVKKARDEITKQADAAGQQADAIRQQASAQEAANASFGKSKTAIEESTLALLKLQLAEADSSDTFDPRYVAGLNAKVEAQQRFVEALQKAELLQKSRSLDEAGRVAAEETQTLQLEVSLLGRTQQEREKVIAQRRVEVALAKELSEIDKLNLGTGPEADAARKALRDKAASNARVQATNAEQKTILDEWQRTTDSINQSLTDALLRGFEDGKGFARNFKDTLKNMFSTMVLKPVIQAVMAPVSGALSGITQGVGSQIVGGGGSALGGAGGFLGAAGSIGSMFGAGGLSGSLMAGAGWLTGASTLTGSLSAAGSLIGTGTAAGALSGLGMAAGALGPIALGALAAYAIFGGKGGGPKTESGFGLGVALRGDPSSSKAVVDAITAQYKAIAGAAAKDLQLGVFTATDPKGTAQTQLDVQATLNGQSISNRGARLGGIENVGRSEAELAAAISEESSRVVLKALAATGLPDKIGAYLRQLGDVDKLSGGTLNTAVAKLQKAMTERQALEAQRFDLTHTELERLTATREKERAAIEEENRAIYDHVAALSDLRAQEATARANLTTAFERESDALKGVIERHHGYAEQLRRVRDSLLTGSDSPLTRSQRAAVTGSRFEGTLSSAVAGNETALQDLGGVSTDFLEAIRNSARTPAELAVGFAKVQAGLTTAAAASDGRATTAQQQLDTMTQQLSALGLLNTSVLSVGEALTAFLSAQASIEKETLRYLTQTAQGSASFAQALHDVMVGWHRSESAVMQDPRAMAEVLRIAQRIDAGNLPGAAAGGLHQGVLQVGEIGPEIVDFETPGRVYTNEQTRGMFSSNAELLPAVRELCKAFQAGDENRRREAVAMLQQLSVMASKLKKFDIDGLPPERVIA